MRAKNSPLLISLILVLAFSWTTGLIRAENRDYYTILSEDGEHILKTSLNITVGDYYLDESNNQYKIIEVDSNNKQAVAKFEKEVQLIDQAEKDKLDRSVAALADDQAENNLVAIYNTHTAESYEPTSGTDSKPGDGDVIDIATQLANALEARGIEVIHDQTRHDPHDGGSYERSRRTAENLAQSSPDALLDIHRDGVPDAEEYTTDIEGEAVAQIKFVIGRQNPQLEGNDQFAKYLKAVSDENYPGLIKGIFYADGKYNQDLSPRSLLLEKGTYTQEIELVEDSVEKFADSLVDMLARMDGEEGIPTQERDGSIIKNIFLLLGIVLGGGFLLLAANEKGVSGAIAKIKSSLNKILGNR